MRNFFFILMALSTLSLASSCSSSDPEPVAEISIPDIELGSNNGDTETFTLTTNYDWTTEIVPAEASSWITVTPSSGSAGDTQVEIIIKNNETPEDREAVVRFVLPGRLTKELNISQSQKDVITTGADPHEIGCEGGDVELEFSYNTADYKVEISHEQESEWLREKGSRSLKDGKITFEVDPNETLYSRTATVTISYGEGKAKAEATIVQSGEAVVFELLDEEFDVDAEGGELNFALTQNVGDYDFEILSSVGGEWIYQNATRATVEEDGYNFTVTRNGALEERETVIRFYNTEFDVEQKLTVRQPAGDGWRDGDYEQLQRATVGRGVNLILMGDGFIEREVNEQGKYRNVMLEAMEDFFSVYPYSQYRDHFNVWAVYGISDESGMSIGNNHKNTLFDSYQADTNSTGISCDYDLVLEYADFIPSLPRNEDKWTVLLLINSPQYAGTCMMSATGLSIAMCPRIVDGSDPRFGKRSVVIHECGGHGFAKLCDEYRYYNTTIPEDDKERIRVWQHYYQSQMNIDFTGDPTEILWKDFLDYPKYTTEAFSPTGAYEGNSYYTKGAWRAENNSCMNDNIDYFNAPSRWEIVRRIKDLAGLPFTFEQFVETDDAPRPTYGSTRTGVEMEMPPLAPPVMVESFKRR